MDNQDPEQPGNPDPVTPAAPAAPVTPTPEAFAWKKELAPDLANAPSMQKFPDTKEGFNEAVKSHLSLEKLLGNEKVPIPKNKDDVAAMALFKKAMGIPDKPEGYGLPDVEIPANLKGLSFDKNTFAKIVHDNNLTPEQVKNLYASYTDMTKQAYAGVIKQQQDRVTTVINQLRQEWGDAYQSKIELGQMVINKFSADKEMNDFVTATLVSDPRGIKFLASIGDQFAENKIGDFKYQRHSPTPEEAEKEIAEIRGNPNHPYNNDKIPQKERDRAIEYVNSLIRAIQRAKG